jgi:hypothetical protein
VVCVCVGVCVCVWCVCVCVCVCVVCVCVCVVFVYMCVVCVREREQLKSARLCTLSARENQSNIFPSACTIVFQTNVSAARGSRPVYSGVQIYVAGIYVACFEGKHRDGSTKICKCS